MNRPIETYRGRSLSATCELVTVHFDLSARVKLPIPADVRARPAGRVVEGP